MKYIKYIALLSLVLASCSDEVLDSGSAMESVLTRAPLEVKFPGGLIQQADGTWLSQNCRVPIVGPGRIVNEINNSTVSVIEVGKGGVENIVDTDISNYSTVPAAISAGVGYTPIISVKDLYHTYAPGQKVGFIYKDAGQGATLLTLDLLQGMTIETYLDGVKQESVYAAQEGNTLGLNLISFNTSDQVTDRELSFVANKRFDEVRMSFTGVSATVASNISLAIKYAFVGENPEIRATSEEQFSSFWTGGSPSIHSGLSYTNVADPEHLVDDDLTNSSPFTVVLYIPSIATINFNRDISEGTEIGFKYSYGTAGGLSLFGQSEPTLTTYDEGNKEVEATNPDLSVLGLSLIGGGKDVISNIVTSKPCRQVKFQHPSKPLELGGMDVYYAYVREGVHLDPANYFSFGDATTYNFSYRLPQPGVGDVSYVVLSHPYGADPSIANSTSGKGNILTGMSRDGAYRVQAFYTAPDGTQLSHTATIYHVSAKNDSGCNKFITSATHGAYAVNPIGWNGCLLCLFNSNNDLNNAVDNNPDNYALCNQVASVLEWTPLAAFKMNKPVVPTETMRTGFVVQANSWLLDLSALSLLKIKLYKGDTLVKESTPDDNSAVNLSLIGTDPSKVRLSINFDQEYDRIELWRKGVADVLTSLRIYNLFYECATCDEDPGQGGCMELLTNNKDNLTIDYEKTVISAGVLQVGSSVKDLDYIIDDKMETGSLLNGGISLGGSTIALKFNKQKGNQSVGIILGGLPDLLTVDVSKVGILRVYDGATQVASTADFSLVGANLISHGGYTYIEVMPKSDFDRIEFTVGGLELLSTSKICGVFLRPDSDGDGIPDCADTEDEEMSMELDGSEFHTCIGNQLNIPLVNEYASSGVSIYCYDQDKKTDKTISARVEGKQIVIPANTLPVGRYNMFIYSADGMELLAYDVEGIVHPRETTWKTNLASTDWNNWNNWTEGSPWTCTDVILPSNAKLYPELKSVEKNYCLNIHFEDGAELVGTQFLTMTGNAFVDKFLQGGRYYMLSSPLKETFTGDMFISTSANWSKAKYFTLLDADNYKESRNRPIVYQHFWNGQANEMKNDLTAEDVGKEQWSGDFNSVATKYNDGQGFLFRAGNDSDRGSYTFRFPKTHTTYHYYNSNGDLSGQSEKISRNMDLVGEFTMPSPKAVTLTNRSAGNVFVMGNPMMAHIDVAKLIAANNSISEIRLFNGRSYSFEKSIQDQTVSSNDDPQMLIAPMEGFFIVAKSSGNSLTVTLTSDMIVQKNNRNK